jgi:PAS domain S-box-containing protein
MEHSKSKPNSELERRFRATFEHAAVGIVNAKADGTFLSVNQQFCDMLGYSSEEMLALTVDKISHTDNIGTGRENIARLWAGQIDTFSMKKRYIHKDGSFVWGNVTVSLMHDDEGAPQYSIAVIVDITEQKRAEEGLRDSEQRMRILLNNAPIAVYECDVDGKISLPNPAFGRITGYSVEELEGMYIWDLMAPGEQKDALPEYLAHLVDEQPAPTRYFSRNQKKDGQLVDVRIDWTYKRDDEGRVTGFVCVLADITDRRNAERNYQSIFNEMLDGFALHDIICDDAGKPVDYRFLAINPAFERLTGLKGSDLIGRTVLEVMPQTEAHWIDTYGHVALTGEPAYFENYARELDRHYEVTAYRPAPGQFACIFVDVTERKRAEAERRMLEKQVRHAQKLESLGVLAGGIAHDFNNLLMVILGNAELAAMELPTESMATNSIEEIKKASQRAAELCTQMLAYSGRGQFVIEPVDLSRVVADMSNMLEVSISKKAILKTEFADNLPAVEADVTQIRQIVMNLITNASEAIGDADGVIRITTGTLECDREYLQGTYLGEELPEGLYVRLVVTDTGCGMDAETQAKLFDPFFTTKFTGRGLGLAAVLGIIRGHGGAVMVSSELGQGTTFNVLLPACTAEAKQVELPVAPDATGEPMSGTILLADDEDGVLDVARRMLERMDLSVIVAADGREAVDIYRSRHGEIDCVILDLAMPHMDGQEAFRELRSIRPDARVVVSSGYDHQEVTDRFVGEGLAGFIQKPYKFDALAETMRNALAGR